MIVEFWLNGEMRRVSQRDEIESAITRVMSELEAEREVPVGFDPGTTATFHAFDIPAGSEVPQVAENALVVGVNRATGYGGLTWWGEEVPENPDQLYWVTKNETPPSFDPRVTADPCYPLWYDKRNVIPLEEVRAAIEQFCFTGGKRPTIVSWDPSTVNGQRLEG